jgi:hypothetical protein
MSPPIRSPDPSAPQHQRVEAAARVVVDAWIAMDGNQDYMDITETAEMV